MMMLFKFCVVMTIWWKLLKDEDLTSKDMAPFWVLVACGMLLSVLEKITRLMGA